MTARVWMCERVKLYIRRIRLSVYTVCYLQAGWVIWRKGILTLLRQERSPPRTEIVALAKGSIHVK